MDRGNNGLAQYPKSILECPEVRRLHSIKIQEELGSSAVRNYLDDREKYQIKSVMISGYQEMANINLSIACEGICLEEEVQELLDKVFGEL